LAWRGQRQPKLELMEAIMARERSGEPARPQPRQPGQSMSIAELRQLITLMQNSDIEEISVEREDDALRLHLRKPAPVAPEHVLAAMDGAGADEVAEAPGPAAAEENGLDHVSAPLVGRFHFGAKPGSKPLVAVGDIVRAGQVVGTIETLNVLTEVESTMAGRVVEVHATEGQPVEYGQVLLTIEPSRE
jgi:acetyl-CoA carboxylase biotin carboxyl carrier protein